MNVRTAPSPPPVPGYETEALAHALHGDPFRVLGPHETPGGPVVRAFLPGAESVEVLRRSDRARIGRLEHFENGLFQGIVSERAPYLLRITWPGGAVQETEDPYSFGPLLGDIDLHLFNEGRHFKLAHALGANVMTIDGVRGTRFAVWAPNAGRVAVVGDFNAWDARRHPMRLRHSAGVWELFVPRVAEGARYKFDIVGAGGYRVPQKADPLAQQTEVPPATASVVASPEPFRWRDDEWMRTRAARHAPDAPLSIYEVHLASWMRAAHDAGASSLWDVAIDRLIPYLADMGFTHVELLPITEHPFGGSWGYQPLSMFAPTARYGTPEGFARFVDALHAAGIGIILDWVPAHFPTDAHGLARFDGTALYEHQDPREGFHQDWNTLIYNFGRREVQGFLIASALHWLEHFHVDGLRVDAVASMLYRDYSRKARRMGAQRPWRAREPRGGRLPAPPQRGRRGALSWRDDDRRGVDRLAGRDPAFRRARARLFLQMEHGLDARHAAVHRARSDPPRLSSRRDHVRAALRVLREIHPAAVARRGRVRKGLADRQDAGRSLAEVREPARLLRIHVGASRQEAAVHGRRDRAMARMGSRRRDRLAGAAATRTMRAFSGWCAISTGSIAPSARCMRATLRAPASAG